MTVGDARLAEVSKHTIYDITGRHALRVARRADRHLLHCQDVHLFLDLKAKYVRCMGLQRLACNEERQVVCRPVHVIAGHVYDATLKVATRFHLGSKEASHHDHRERVCIGGLDELGVRLLVNLTLTGIEALNVVH